MFCKVHKSLYKKKLKIILIKFLYFKVDCHSLDQKKKKHFSAKLWVTHYVKLNNCSWLPLNKKKLVHYHLFFELDWGWSYKVKYALPLVTY